MATLSKENIVEMNERPTTRGEDAADHDTATQIHHITNLAGQDTPQLQKGQAHELKQAVQLLLVQSREVGLEPDQLVQVVDLAASGKLDRQLSRELFRCLIPRSHVPWLAPVKAISWLGVGELHSSLRVVLVKWIVSVFHYVDEDQKLRALYGIIFLYLEDVSLCRPVAQLLYQLTRSQDVEPVRVKRLVELASKMGSPPVILDLLRLYKTLRPDLVPLSFKKQNRTSVAVSGSTDWIPRARKHQPHIGESELAIPRNRYDRDDLIPAEQIRTFEELIHYYDRMKLPSQAATILRRPIFHVLATCRTDADIKLRLDLWLEHVLLDCFIRHPGSYHHSFREQLLADLLRFEEYTQVGMLASSLFVARYLHIWNGHDHRAAIFDLISRLHVFNFEDFHDFILTPMRKFMLSSPLDVKVTALKKLTQLLRNTARNGCKSEDSTHDGSPPDEARTVRVLTRFVDYVGQLCVLLLNVENDHLLLLLTALEFFEEVPKLFLANRVPVVPLMPPALVHKALFSVHAIVVSRLCTLICSYKRTISAIKNSPAVSAHPIGSAAVSVFNTTLLEVSNTLWRNKPFAPSSDSNTLVQFGFKNSDLKRMAATTKQDAFSIYLHFALLGHAIRFVQVTQNVAEDEVVNPRYLFTNKAGSKDVFLEYLKRQELPGIQEFVTEFIGRKSNMT